MLKLFVNAGRGYAGYRTKWRRKSGSWFLVISTDSTSARSRTGGPATVNRQIVPQKRATPKRREAPTVPRKTEGHSDLEPCLPHLHLSHCAHNQKQSDHPPAALITLPIFASSRRRRLLRSVIDRCQPNEVRPAGPQTRASALRGRRETCVRRRVSHPAMYGFPLGGPARARRQRSGLLSG